MIRFATVAAACALAICSTSALAAAESSATISGLSFTLIDLNPRDGITPSFSFLSSSGSTLMTVGATDNLLGEADSASRKRAGTFTATGQLLADLTNAGASASITNTSLTAAGSAFGPSTSYNASASTGSVNAYPYYYSTPLNLSLSANSLLLIEAVVDLKASATNPSACSYYYYCSSSESASASASLSLSYNYSTGGTSASVNDNKSASLQASARGGYTDYTWEYDPTYGYYRPVYHTYPDLEEVKNLHETLTTVFTNASGLTQFGSLGMSVSVAGQATTAPAVPEPEGYALAIAGLCVAGVLARRRRG